MFRGFLEQIFFANWLRISSNSEVNLNYRKRLSAMTHLPSSPSISKIKSFQVSTPRNGGVSCGGVACIPGVVTVVDLSRVPKPSKKCKHVVVGTNNEFGPSGMEEVLAHFPAYTGEEN